jgi:putative salt-induced outer membrane protein
MRIQRMRCIGIGIFAILLPSLFSGISRADDAPPTDTGSTPRDSIATAQTATAGTGGEQAGGERQWKGEVEAGVINTTGNSHSNSLRARLKLQYEPGIWKHSLTADYLQVSESGATTTKQFNGALKSDRTLTVRSYLFATARYETDRIAGYSPRVAESAGYGRRFPFSERVRLEAEIGAGGRHAWFTDGTRESEAILRLAAKFSWKLNSLSEFNEEAFSEFGKKNVHSESQTSLTTRINASFSLKANVAVKHDTVVIAGRAKTDTITSMTLVYDL